MSSTTTHITITGYQLQQALAYVAPDLTPGQLRDSVRIELTHQEDGQSVAAAVTMVAAQHAPVPLDDHLQWPEQHPDERIVDGWASAIKDRFAQRCGRNRRDIAAQGRLTDGWTSGVFTSCGWNRASWTQQQISASLIVHLYRQELLEVAIHALILRERGMSFDRSQMRQVIPHQALEVAAEMRVDAQRLREGACAPASDQQLDKWADHIETAIDTRSQIAHLIAAPVMYEALLADQNAVLAEREHTSLMQKARHEGWYGDQKHPGHETIRNAAQARWEQEIRAFNLKRQAFQLATTGLNALGDRVQTDSGIENAAGASYRTLSVDILQAKEPMAAAA